MKKVFTHDMHDHFLPSNIKQNGQVLKLGGYARLQSAFKAEKESNPDSLLMMQTIFQWVLYFNPYMLVTHLNLE